MARYDHLPIWHTAMELAVAVEFAVAHFPRAHRYPRVLNSNLNHQKVIAMPASQSLARSASRRCLHAAAAVLASLSLTHAAFAATCPGNLGASTTPTSDFVVNNDGTVTHTPTGLMWKQCNEGLSGPACATGTVSSQDWPTALTTARNSTFAGYTDWRLPTKQELESLVDNTCFSPAINDTVFPATVAYWTWTSTTNVGSPANAWIVSFYGGNSNVGYKNGAGAVRLVRGGQSFDAFLAAQTLTFGAAPSGVVAGGSATVAATSASPNSGNAISYSSLTPAVCSVNASTGAVSALTAGTCTIAADQAGNASYAAAAQVTQSFTIILAAQTLTFGAAPSGVVVGGSATVAATSASPNSGNPISYSSLTPAVCSVNASTGAVSALTAGTCTIAANQAGNAIYAAAAQVTQSFTIILAAQTLTFGAAPSGVVVGGSATVAATSASPNSGNPISYSSLTPAVCSVNASTGAVSALTAGTCTIAANQAGNAIYAAAAQVTQSFTISAAVVPALDWQALLALALLLVVAGSMRLRLRRQR